MNEIKIKDLLGLAEPATRLIEIVSSAIGTLYEPHRIKRLADAEAYKLNKITETAKETNFNGEIELLDGKVTINSTSPEIKTTITNEIKRLLYETENIKRIADFAYNELENNKNEIKENIDEDWKNYFFDKGRKIYSEDLQFIFGKILAGEIIEPGTYSKRLLNILSNLSQKEATIFRKISGFVLRDNNNSFIISDKEILNNFNIKLEEIILLEEAGLINSNQLTISNINIYKYKNYLINFENNRPSLNIYILTKSGCELEKIINNEINLEYLSKIKQKYKINKMKYSLIVSKDIIGEQVHYSLKDEKNKLNRM